MKMAVFKRLVMAGLFVGQQSEMVVILLTLPDVVPD